MTHVVVPVRDQCALTMTIVEQLREYGGFDRAWMFDNGSTDATPDYLREVRTLDSRFTTVDAPGDTIYEMWGRGLGLARAHDADHVAILNNDLVLAPGTLQALSGALDRHPDLWVTYPDYDRRVAQGVGETALRRTSGTYRHGGMCGYAFMLNVAHITWEPLIDPHLTWWAGDDDLAFEIEERGGGQGRVVGLPVDHLGGATSAVHPQPSAGADLEYVIAKWGR